MIVDDVKRRVIIVAPCFLNFGLVACGFHNKAGIKYRINFLKKLLNLAEEHYIGLDTYYCSEFEILGLPRPPCARATYEERQKEVETYVRKTIEKIEKLLKNGFEILAIIGVEGSPCCGVTLTKLGKAWSKEDLEKFRKEYELGSDLPDKYYSQLSHRQPGMGVFMELLSKALDKLNKNYGQNIEILGWALNKEDEIIEKIKSKL